MAQTRRLQFDLFNGMRALAFVSFVMGVSTFVVCGWTFLSNRLNIDSKLFTNSVVVTAKLKPNVSSSETSEPTSHLTLSSDPADVEVFDLLRDAVVRCSIIVVLLVVVQIVSAVFILGSSAQSCRARIKMWFVLNSGINVAILICLTMPLMYQIQHANHLQTSNLDNLEMGAGGSGSGSGVDSDGNSTPQNNGFNGMASNSSLRGTATATPNTNVPRINHLHSFYIALASDFLAQFVALISCLLLLRFNKQRRLNYEHVGSLGTM